MHNRTLAEKYTDEALQLLGVDEDAAKVIDAYYLHPRDPFVEPSLPYPC
jgi:hypothetical protein